MKFGPLALAASVLFLGCGSESSSEGGDGSGGGDPIPDPDPNDPPIEDPPIDGEWELLLSGEWAMPSLTEDYLCVVATVPRDMVVGAFRPIAPEGTHHTVLTRVSGAVDGVFSCNAGTNGENQIYGSGVGTNPFYFPAGVAVRLNKGEQVMLNLHLFNLTSEDLTGVSGVEVIAIDASEVDNFAETTLAGTLDLELPPKATTTAEGNCSLPTKKTLFGIAPHMHQLGTHIKVTVLSGDNETVVHDGSYAFEDQRVFLLDEPVEILPTDQVRVSCTYDNTTSDTVYWGDSSFDEMCFAGLSLYPATGIPLVCTDSF